MSKTRNAVIKDWQIEIDESGSVKVSRDNQVCDNSKAALRDVAAAMGWTIDPDWTVRKLGKYILDVKAMVDAKAVRFDGRTTVGDLKRFFKAVYNVSLRVYEGKRLADDSLQIGKLRNEDATAKTGALVCRASITVGGLIKRVKETFGIDIKIATQDDWVLVLDGITLSNAGKIKKQATIADMQEYVGYQRENDDDVVEGEEEKVAKEENNVTTANSQLPRCSCVFGIYFVLDDNPVGVDWEDDYLEDSDFYDDGGFYVYRYKKDGLYTYGIAKWEPSEEASDRNINIEDLEIFPMYDSEYKNADEYRGKPGIYFNSALYALSEEPGKLLELCPSTDNEIIPAAILAFYDPRSREWSLGDAAECFIIDDGGNVVLEWTASKDY